MQNQNSFRECIIVCVNAKFVDLFQARFEHPLGGLFQHGKTQNDSHSGRQYRQTNHGNLPTPRRTGNPRCCQTHLRAHLRGGAQYDDLDSLLYLEPSYNHQRAKAYVRCAYYALRHTDASQAEVYLRNALHFVIGAIEIYQKIFDDSGNDKVKISLDHAIYTHAVILCHLVKLHDYNQIDEIRAMLETLYKAFLSPNNSYSYAKKDTLNFNNVLVDTLNYLSRNHAELDAPYTSYLEYLINEIFSQR